MFLKRNGNNKSHGERGKHETSFDTHFGFQKHPHRLLKSHKGKLIVQLQVPFLQHTNFYCGKKKGER